METLDAMAREGDGRTIMISCEIDLGLDWLLESIWQVSAIIASSSLLISLGARAGKVSRRTSNDSRI